MYKNCPKVDELLAKGGQRHLTVRSNVIESAPGLLRFGARGFREKEGGTVPKERDLRDMELLEARFGVELPQHLRRLALIADLGKNVSLEEVSASPQSRVSNYPYVRTQVKTPILLSSRTDVPKNALPYHLVGND